MNFRICFLIKLKNFLIFKLTKKNDHKPLALMKKVLSLILILILFLNIDCSKIMLSIKNCCPKSNKTIEKNIPKCHQEQTTKNDEGCNCPKLNIISSDNFKTKIIEKIIFVKLLFSSPLNTVLILPTFALSYNSTNTNFNLIQNPEIYNISTIQILI